MTNVLHLSLERTAHDSIRLDFGLGATAKSFVVGFDSIRTLIDDAERGLAEAKGDELVAMGRGLFDWLNGDQRFTDLLKSFPNSIEPVALAVNAPPEFGHLPWEILHDGTEFLVMRRVRPVLPVRMRNANQGAAVPAPANRPLRVLFMATSPENTPQVIDFEKEEGNILAAAGDMESPIELVVEESGTLKELRKTIQRTKPGAFDVVQLLGHADYLEGQPVFLSEDDAGQKNYASPEKIVEALSEMPPLVFLSVCKTAKDVRTGAVRYLSEQLIEKGARAVLGWERPDMDFFGIAAAKALYGGLSVGNNLFNTLAGTYRAMGKAEEEISLNFPTPVPSNWHLLRLFANESVPGAFVTSPDEDERELPGRVSFLEDFADPWTNQMRAISRERFVGRRRLLQRCLKTLKSADLSGIVLHGLGGNGKTCIAARLCDRLGRDFTPIIHIGRLKESDLVFRLNDAFLEEKHLRDILAGIGQPNDDPFEVRLKRVIRRAERAFLFVLDDFEQNYANLNVGFVFTPDRKPILDDEAHRVLTALLEAVADPKNKVKHRVILTSRFELEGDFAAKLVQESVNCFKDADLAKFVSRLRAELDAKLKAPPLNSKYNGGELNFFENEAVKIAGGNARLLRSLHDLIAEPNVDLREIFETMKGKQACEVEEIPSTEIQKKQPKEKNNINWKGIEVSLFRKFVNRFRMLVGFKVKFIEKFAMGLVSCRGFNKKEENPSLSPNSRSNQTTSKSKKINFAFINKQFPWQIVCFFLVFVIIMIIILQVKNYFSKSISQELSIGEFLDYPGQKYFLPLTDQECLNKLNVDLKEESYEKVKIILREGHDQGCFSIILKDRNNDSLYNAQIIIKRTWQNKLKFFKSPKSILDGNRESTVSFPIPPEYSDYGQISYPGNIFKDECSEKDSFADVNLDKANKTLRLTLAPNKYQGWVMVFCSDTKKNPSMVFLKFYFQRSICDDTKLILLKEEICSATESIKCSNAICQ